MFLKFNVHYLQFIDQKNQVLLVGQFVIICTGVTANVAENISAVNILSYNAVDFITFKVIAIKILFSGYFKKVL